MRPLVAAAELTLAARPNDSLASAVRLARHAIIDAAAPDDAAQAELRSLRELEHVHRLADGIEQASHPVFGGG